MPLSASSIQLLQSEPTLWFVVLPYVGGFAVSDPPFLTEALADAHVIQVSVPYRRDVADFIVIPGSDWASV